ncbi:AEC family transporter [Aerococcus sanguinicola]|uniref:AEC family transporter n=1 Tax=Aerococcus TaxID=1375 RepID=UPI0008B7411F|nr:MULTISPECIES: AEC family transporter [Aerococcus]MDK7050429.1 AEC family transporter [Aerococcus sanguinicola]OFT94520.1 hypothetical protein HMPREF3090_05505 [Aerococcus sp. HMSC23C02]
MSAIIPMLILLATLFLGYWGQKVKLFTKSAQYDFSTMITYISSPALILSTINSAGELGTKDEALTFLAIAFIIYFFYMAFSFIVPKFIPVAKESEGTLQFLMTFQNNGFMGIPVIQALYGAGAMFYASLMNVPSNILVYSFGVWVMSRYSQKEEGQLSLRKIFLSPGFLASLIALAFFILDWKIPQAAETFLSLVGNMTTPLAMIVIGMSMTEIKFRDCFNDWRIYLLMLIKMVLLPIIIYYLFGSFLSHPIIISVLVVTAAMPGPSSATAYATIFDGDVTLATRYVFVSTLFSVLIIPLIISLLNLAG